MFDEPCPDWLNPMNNLNQYIKMLLHLIIWPISLNAHAEHKMFGMVTPTDCTRRVFYTNKSFVSFSYEARSKTLFVIFFKWHGHSGKWHCVLKISNPSWTFQVAARLTWGGPIDSLPDWISSIVQRTSPQSVLTYYSKVNSNIEVNHLPIICTPPIT